MVKNKRLVGGEREKAISRAVKLYEKGKPVRAIATELDRSYGWVHRVLIDSGVTLRARGGNQRNKKS
jgi:hypothetical protein